MGLLLLGVLSLIFITILAKNKKTPINQGCTMEAMQCPDGSYVGRTGPDCEFVCPNSASDSGFENPQAEAAILDYLLTREYFNPGKNEVVLCVAQNLDAEKQLFPLYVWAMCGEYVVQNGEVAELGGISVPVKIKYPNELSFFDPNEFSFKVPRDGSYYTEDIKKIFPENLHSKIFTFSSDGSSKVLSDKLKAKARTELIDTPLLLENLNSQIEVIGGQKDSYGCLYAAGYTWCESKNKCLRTWEEECQK